jgi:hypothetical protein
MDNTGSLTALTAKLPSQPLTSHPSVRSLLENGMKRIQKQLCFVLIEICSDFEYSEESVVVSNNLITRYVYAEFSLNSKKIIDWFLKVVAQALHSFSPLHLLSYYAVGKNATKFVVPWSSHKTFHFDQYDCK